MQGGGSINDFGGSTSGGMPQFAQPSLQPSPAPTFSNQPQMNIAQGLNNQPQPTFSNQPTFGAVPLGQNTTAGNLDNPQSVAQSASQQIQTSPAELQQPTSSQPSQSTSIQQKPENKTNVLAIILGSLAGIFAIVMIVFIAMFVSKGDELDARVAEYEQKLAAVPEYNPGVKGRFYLLDNISQGRRYHLVFDESAYGMSVDYDSRKVYLLDMNFSETQPIMKEIDLKGLLQNYIDSKRTSIPEDLTTPSGVQFKKEDCSNKTYFYPVKSDIFIDGIDWANDITFSLNYRCIYNSEELDFGSELYVYHANQNTVDPKGVIDSGLIVNDQPEVVIEPQQ